MTDFINLKQRLDQDFCPVWVLYGNDQWLKQKALDNIIEHIHFDMPDFNIAKLENSKDVDQLFVMSAVAPLGDSVRLTIGDNFILPQGKKLQEFADRLQKFALYNDGSMAIVFLSDSAEGYTNIKGVELVDCNRLNENTVTKWITSYVAKQGKTIDNTASKTLAQYCINDMARISTEIAKLCDYVATTITVADIQQLVHKDAEYMVFDLGKVIANKNVYKALDMLKSLLASGEEVRSLFVMLYNYYRRLYYIRSTKYTDEQLANLLQVRAGAIRYQRDIANRYKPMQLRTALRYFLQADRKIKAFYNDTEVVTNLIFMLAEI